MPVFQEPYRNLTHGDRIDGAALKREIAARTHVNVAVVELILETFKEVATEEIVNKGDFNLAGLFQVGNYPTKETVTPKGTIPARLRLKLRLNDRVKKLWNGKLNATDDDRKSFQELMEDYNDRGAKPKIVAPTTKPAFAFPSPSKTLEEPVSIDTEAGAFNPMLEDDEDEY